MNLEIGNEEIKIKKQTNFLILRPSLRLFLEIINQK